MMPPARKMVAESNAAFAASAGPDQAEPREEECDHRGGKDLEEAFHPQMNHPPAPVFHDGQMRVLAPGQARAVEEPDGARRKEQEEPEQRLVVRRLLQRGPDRRAPPGRARSADRRTAGSARRAPGRHTHSPDGPRGTRWHLTSLIVDAQPFSGHRADHDSPAARRTARGRRGAGISAHYR